MPRLLLGQLGRRHRRLATLGLASLVAAASFTAVTASANSTFVQVRQAPNQNLRGARRASTSSAKQKVRCVSGMGVYRREDACKTPMRLVCHKSPGQTVLRGIPSQAYWVEQGGTMVWHIEFAPVSPDWGVDGPPVEHGRLSIRTPRGARREEAIVSLSTGMPPPQVLISAPCS